MRQHSDPELTLVISPLVQLSVVCYASEDAWQMAGLPD